MKKKDKDKKEKNRGDQDEAKDLIENFARAKEDLKKMRAVLDEARKLNEEMQAAAALLAAAKAQNAPPAPAEKTLQEPKKATPKTIRL